MKLAAFRLRALIGRAHVLGVFLFLVSMAGNAFGQPWGGVNGYSVAEVRHSQQGRFQTVGAGQWVESSDNGGDGFRFQETGRDEWSVYLVDPSRNVRIQLDLHRKLVLYGDASAPEMRPLYAIVDVRGGRSDASQQPPPAQEEQEAPEPPPPVAAQPAPVAATINANGFSVTRVAFGQPGQPSGDFSQIGPGVWQEHSNGTAGFRFNETGRDEWSVYLVDPSRGVRLQLDLHRRQVMYGDARSAEMRPLYVINFASADAIRGAAANVESVERSPAPDTSGPGTISGSNSASQKDFCWKDSYPRGAGTVPQACPYGRERIGLLCYTACPANSRRFGFDCHTVCPAGMADDGLFCRSREYARTPYAASLGDLMGPSNRERCEKAQGRSCEKAVGDPAGSIFYARCDAGFSSFPLGICRPQRPNCAALGMGDQFDLSCAKKIVIGDPVTGSCAAGESENAGLCYAKCQSGYTGVGPVCWTGAPSNWVECGMGAARNSFTCGQIVFGQVASVGQLAFNIATLPTGAGAASGAASAAPRSARLADLKRKFQALTTLYEQNKAAIQATMAAKRAAGAAVHDVKLLDDDVVTEEDIIRISAEIAAIADPTGVSGAVAAYTYPKCSKYNF